MTKHSKAGFALIDVLVTLAVIGLIASALTGLLRFSVQNLLYIENLKNKNEEFTVAQRLLRALLEGVPSFVSNDRRQPVIRGTNSAIQIWSSGPPILAFNNPHLLSLTVEKRSEKRAMVLQWTAQDHAQRSETIISDIADLQFEYFLTESSDKDRKRKWITTLPVPPYHVQAVKMKLQLSEPRTEMVFIYSVLTTMPHACTADPGQFGCP